MKNAFLKIAAVTFASILTASVGHAAIVISEVHPSGSGNAPYAADFFELTNTGGAAVDITDWKMDDNSHVIGSAVALAGVTSIPAGKSAIFMETSTPAASATAFTNAWFGNGVTPPGGILVGSYSGSGVGLSTSGDEVVVFNAGGTIVTGVAFGAATNNVTFDNAAGVGSGALPFPSITSLSVAGVNGAFSSAGSPTEIGSPGRIAATPEPTTLAAIGSVVMAVTGRRRK